MMRNLISITLLAGAILLCAQPAGPKTYATPEEARDALVQAAKNGLDAVRDLLGPTSTDILRTGDPVQDQTALDKFNQRAAQKTKLEADPMNPDQVTLLLGDEEFPFAVPLERKDGRWYFDVQEGKAEIRRRVIGQNELDAIEVCRGYVEAQEDYAEGDWDGKGVHQYAQKIASSPGKKDGLYWDGEDSPVAAAFAKAASQGYSAPSSAGKGYHGYMYKVLLSQGPDAEGGAQDYVVHGLMIGGFALVAWPAEYGVSGIMTFIVNQDGVVYEKDLGTHTNAAVKAMTRFNPDKTWKPSAD